MEVFKESNKHLALEPNKYEITLEFYALNMLDSSSR